MIIMMTHSFLLTWRWLDRGCDPHNSGRFQSLDPHYLKKNYHTCVRRFFLKHKYYYIPFGQMLFEGTGGQEGRLFQMVSRRSLARGTQTTFIKVSAHEKLLWKKRWLTRCNPRRRLEEPRLPKCVEQIQSQLQADPIIKRNIFSIRLVHT